MSRQKEFLNLTIFLSVLFGAISIVIGSSMMPPSEWDSPSLWAPRTYEVCDSTTGKYFEIKFTSPQEINENILENVAKEVKTLPTIIAIRSMYPEYKDLNDYILAQQLSKKFPKYKDLPVQVLEFQKNNPPLVLTAEYIDGIKHKVYRQENLLLIRNITFSFLVGFAGIWFIYFFSKYVIWDFVIKSFKDNN